MTNPPDLVVFSDLDGTLLDHETYDWSPAKPALHRLAQIGCPVVLTSSKTAAEIVVLQQAMGLSDYPAIVENGAGVIGLPGQDDIAEDYEKVRQMLDAIPPSLRKHFTGFGDMSADEIATLTGLSPDAARLAMKRDFSEPGLWTGHDAAKDAFLAAIQEQGLTATQGGRFLTLSFGATKADGMARVLARYKPKHSIALGDAPNDIAMLEAAEFGVIVANPHRDPLPHLKGEAEGRISRTRDAGPHGWNTAVCALLYQLGLTTGTHANG
ncbi:HAD-IIB family hydrolase [Marivita hallyeonensis]|uniref:Mannosyl-3-phosphoglycerate phosphatase n=1 Tax=Marivita hallyeonensis TaxID=996342 RepID=A0A1M5LM33_9RHOB|nr:HAD-IIB family hydrolase [Marivita hallyeonensis]SHG66108.1 mannosyl-3-phosphoglycerate phosphatase [Marivita hallyeonensis]